MPVIADAPPVRRFVVAEPGASVFLPGQLVMARQELSRFTTNRIIGSFAETGRAVHANFYREPERIEVDWNYSTGSIDEYHLIAVQIVPAGTPGAIEAWVNGLRRYAVRVTTYGPRDEKTGTALSHFTDELPDEDHGEEHYRDRWALPLAKGYVTSPGFCDGQRHTGVDSCGLCWCRCDCYPF